MGSTFRLSVGAQDVLQRIKIERSIKTSSKALEYILLNYRPTNIKLRVAEDKASELSQLLAKTTRVLESRITAEKDYLDLIDLLVSK